MKLTEQTIKSVKLEATKQESEKWKDKIRGLHNDLAFMGDTVDVHYICDRLYEMMKESEDGTT